MTTAGWLPADTEDLFGPDATAEEAYEVLTVDVPPAAWIPALETARDRLGCTYFDWLSAVDEPGTGFRVAAHVVALSPVRRLLLRTTVPHDAPTLPTAGGVYAGAGWHERETHEMFGVVFEGHPGLDHLLLPEGFEGHPLRKDFVLAARVAKAWPGAKEPGESEHGGPKRRQMLPPGVPDPNEWGPLKGQLPPAPARGAGRAAGDRPVRRTRTAAEGPAGQATPTPATETPATPSPAAETPARPPRRARTASEGSVSQAAPAPEGARGADAPATGPRRARSAGEGSASQRTGAAPGPRRTRSASEGSATQRPAPADSTPGEVAQGAPTAPPAPKPAPRSPDAPWHHARPAHEDPHATDRPDDATDRPDDAPEASQDSEAPQGSQDPEAPQGSEAPQAPEDSAGGPQ